MDASETTIGGKSLLSLSIAAANANPIPTGTIQEGQECEPESDMQQDSGISSWSASLSTVGTNASLTSTKSLSQLHKHRRMSSLGQSRRRTSDAREAGSRPSATAVHTAASTLASLATLSLSPSTTGNIPGREGRQSLVNSEADPRLEGMGISISLPKDGKKGAIFKCETCSKVYRHPSCLVKHRWEHSPHWRETSKFLLSKHQQVQLLEAAAILSNLSPSARGRTSLPDDRGLWPAYVSGGKLYPMTNITTTLGTEKRSLAMSSSLPSSHRLNRTSYSSPTVHEHAVTSASDAEHVRPGVFSVDRNDQDSISRTVSSPIDLRSVKVFGGISSRSKSEKDDSDFEMDGQSMLSCTFDHSQGKSGGWDGLEMEMEM